LKQRYEQTTSDFQSTGDHAGIPDGFKRGQNYSTVANRNGYSQKRSLSSLQSTLIVPEILSQNCSSPVILGRNKTQMQNKATGKAEETKHAEEGSNPYQDVSMLGQTEGSQYHTTALK